MHRRPGRSDRGDTAPARTEEQTLVDRPQQEGGVTDPVGERRTIEIDALPGMNLRLTIEWQMISVFGYENPGDQSLCGNAALDQPRRSGRLHDRALVGPAGVSWPPHDEHAELRRCCSTCAAHAP